MDRQSSTSGNGSYSNCSKIFDPHGVVPPSVPRANWTLSEMVPERCLRLALERLLARRPEGIPVNPAECGETGPDCTPRGKFLNASARRSNCSPFRSANRHASLIVRELLI